MSRTDLARRAGGGLAGLALLLVAAYAVLALAPAPELANRAGFSQAVFDAEGGLLRLSLSSDEKYRFWVPLEQVSPLLVQATLAQEDRYFFAHPGVNPVSLARAFARTYLARGRRVGGSTLSMQLARLRFGLDSRSVGGKLAQIARALQLEARYDKRALLEAYLNLAPYGGNVEGVGAASLVYFQKTPAQLSAAEALSLALIPKSPRSRSPERATGRAALAAARERLYREMRAPGEVGPRDSLEVRFHARAELPSRAPHFARRVLGENPFEPRLDTTLDPRLQAIVERQVGGFVARNRVLGLRNAVVLIAHTRSAEIRAYVGSADPDDAAIHGQVDGVRARRSPGSALKPFLYGLALDAGLIHPRTMLKDASFAVSAWNPENSDGDFLGPLSATEALVRSRNLPAVQLANELGPDALHGLLARARIAGLRDAGHYGLALTLGGVELRMDELVGLYAALAEGGELRALHALPARDPDAAAPTRLLSPEASHLVLEMLRSNPRPDLDLAGSPATSAPSVPWKTGTSWGFRDAWAVGIVGPYALGVWVGNFDGSPNPAFVGREAAGPLFFAIADALRGDPALSAPPRPAPAGVRQVEVCALSGALPGPHCTRRALASFIPGRSPIAACAIHREVWIDPETGLRACSESGARRVVLEFWPSDLLRLFRAAGVPRRAPPPFSPACRGASPPGIAPRISSPQPSLRYALRRDREIPFSAVSDADSQRLWWFVDDAFVGTSAPGETLWWRPRAGRFQVRAVDENGRVGEAALTVGTP